MQFVEFIDNYSETSGKLWQYFKIKANFNNDLFTAGTIANSEFFTFKNDLIGNIDAYETDNVEMIL